MSIEDEHKELMQTLDDAWNNQDWDTFEARHAKNTAVYWPGQPEPTRGVENHRQESIEFCKTFENHLDNRPYRVLIADGDWTCSVARWTGKMVGPMKGPDGKEIPPTGKSFELDFCTVARWQNGQIVEENLFYDQVGLMRQIGLSD
jgi:ketosteroid isomerase-like protein